MTKKRTASPKEITKGQVSAIIAEALQGQGFQVINDPGSYGFTKFTLVARGEQADVQIKLISPKAGLDRYEPKEEEEGDE